MLRSLGRNAALERCRIHFYDLSNRFSQQPYRSFPVGKHNSTLLALRHRNASVVIETSHLTQSSRYAFSTSARLLTTPISTKSTSPAEPPTPTPPTLKPPSKPKVELRPGPIKSGVSNKPSTSAPPTPPPPSAPSPTTSHSVEAGAQKLGEKAEKSVEERKEPGLIEITKADYERAIQHGILAPPPADAGRIGKLYHQAKEIFVSWSLSHYLSFRMSALLRCASGLSYCATDILSFCHTVCLFLPFRNSTGTASNL